MQLSGAHRCVQWTGALLLPVEAAVSAEPARTFARDEAGAPDEGPLKPPLPWQSRRGNQWMAG
jgi:hypothetical protein